MPGPAWPTKYPSRETAENTIGLQRALLPQVENHCREDRFGTNKKLSLGAVPIVLGVVYTFFSRNLAYTKLGQ